MKRDFIEKIAQFLSENIIENEFYHLGRQPQHPPIQSMQTPKGIDLITTTQHYLIYDCANFSIKYYTTRKLKVINPLTRMLQLSRANYTCRNAHSR